MKTVYEYNASGHKWHPTPYIAIVLYVVMLFSLLGTVLFLFSQIS